MAHGTRVVLGVAVLIAACAAVLGALVWNVREEREETDFPFGLNLEPGDLDDTFRRIFDYEERNRQEIRVAADDLLDWYAAPQDSDDLDELFVICSTVPSTPGGLGDLPNPTPAPHEAAIAAICGDVERSVVQRSVQEWRDGVRTLLAGRDEVYVEYGQLAVEAQVMRLRNWASVVLSGRDLDSDYLIRFCTRMAPRAFHQVASPPDPSRDGGSLAVLLTDLCNVVLVADAITPVQWAIRIQNEIQID